MLYAERPMSRCLVSASLVLLVGCGDDSAVGGALPGGGGSGAAGGGTDGGGGAAPAAIEWQACEAFREFPPTETSETAAAECATIQVPLDWSEPAGPTIEIFVKRVPAVEQPATRQLWMLNGGPGAASVELDPYLLEWTSGDPQLEVYTTDFRGVGKSTPLPCSDNDIAVGKTQNCAEDVESEIGSLDGFTTTQAARDVAELIRRTRADARVTVYGLSFGTYWAHRLLQVEPELADGVVLDSIVPADVDWADFSPNADAIAHSFFDVCASDGFCAEKLGADPWAQAEAFFALPPASACGASLGVSQADLRAVMTQALRKIMTRPLVPALVYRLLRCSPDDEDALANLFQFLNSLPPEPDGVFALPLYMHIVLSELWPLDPLTIAEYDAIDAALTIAPSSTGLFQALWEEWPVTPRDTFAGEIAVTSTPVLMLQGGLDPQTPDFAAAPLIDALVGQGNTVLEFPLSPHAIVSGSPLASDPLVHCGALAVLAFAVDGRTTAPACLDDLATIDFGDNVDLATQAFDQGSIWEPIAAQSAGSRSPNARATRRALLELARDLRR